jgi:hypothetical protein
VGTVVTSEAAADWDINVENQGEHTVDVVAVGILRVRKKCGLRI